MWFRSLHLPAGVENFFVSLLPPQPDWCPGCKKWRKKATLFQFGWVGKGRGKGGEVGKVFSLCSSSNLECVVYFMRVFFSSFPETRSKKSKDLLTWRNVCLEFCYSECTRGTEGGRYEYFLRLRKWLEISSCEGAACFFSSCFPRKKWLEGGFSRVVAPERKSFWLITFVVVSGRKIFLFSDEGS